MKTVLFYAGMFFSGLVLAIIFSFSKQPIPDDQKEVEHV